MEKKKILIADDNKEYVKTLKRVIGSDYEISEAYNSDDAIKMSNKEKFDLIISDNDMEDGYESSGLHLIEEIKKGNKNKETEILFHSSGFPKGIAEKAEKLGVKACNKMDFFQNIKKLLK